MKPTKLNKKLRFSRETVVDLNINEQKAAFAGKEEEYDYFTSPCTITVCMTECPSCGYPCQYC